MSEKMDVKQEKEKADGVAGHNQSVQTPSSHNAEPPPPSYNETVSSNLALYEDFVGLHPGSLEMRGHTFSRDFEVVDAVGTEWFRVDSSSFSTSHEMTVLHSSSGHRLFTIKKKTFSMSWRYSAEMPPGRDGDILFETETQPGFFSGGETYMTFQNVVTGQKDTLEVELHTMTGPSIVRHHGKHIADIDKITHATSSSYRIDIHIAGIDPLLMVALALVIDDRLRTKRRRANN